MEKEAGEKKEKKYLVEFANYKEAKIAKDKLNETYDNELVEVNSGLHQVNEICKTSLKKLG